MLFMLILVSMCELAFCFNHFFRTLYFSVGDDSGQSVKSISSNFNQACLRPTVDMLPKNVYNRLYIRSVTNKANDPRVKQMIRKDDSSRRSYGEYVLECPLKPYRSIGFLVHK
uniref:Putative secreted protein n=1 Tax=Anopheles darlingi TaxID=43151 RepID=A0A2M4D958_ANODA